ncbi:Uncharacterized protein APZ42_007360 [Daphnia magna]|uniref:Uncharacterized protein n=1 Tax=Daphnia magna TaxID=35525 RepID=A0A164FC41_9CRUS|nr:Uncharacterized protein APZ42_007360 [Daphnia magna]
MERLVSLKSKKTKKLLAFPPFFLTRQEETAEYLPHAALNKPPRAQRLRRQNLERKLSDIFQEGKKPFDSFHFISRFLSTPFPIFQLVTLQPPSSLFFTIDTVAWAQRKMGFGTVPNKCTTFPSVPVVASKSQELHCLSSELSLTRLIV